MSQHPAPRYLAERIVVDRAQQTVTVNGEPFEWPITSDVTVNPADLDDGLLAEVTVTIVGEQITTSARDALLAIDGRELPWYITEAGPRIALVDNVFHVTVELLADHAEEIGAEAEAAR